MIILLCKIVSIWIFVIGIVFFANPQIAKAFFRFWKHGKRLYFAALIRFLLGVLFLLGATNARYSWVIAISGVLFILGGFIIILIGPKRLRGILEWGEGVSKALLRSISVLVMAFGVLLLVSI